MKFSTVQKAFLAVIAANAIWGAAAPIFKVSLTNIPPYTLAFWRFFLGAFILLAVLRKKANLPKTTTRKDISLLIGYALSGITFNIIFFFLGLQLTYSINAPVIASAQPIITFFLALFFLHETFHLKKFSGMLLGTIGIAMIVIEPLLEKAAGGSILGNMFLVIAMLSAVVQTIIGKKLFARLDPMAITFWAFLIGSASFLPLAAMEYTTIPNLYQALDWRGIMGLVYGAAISSAAGYALYGWGLSKISATDVAMFTYIDPILGTILGSVFLHEPITTYFLLGSVLIFGGIFVAEGRFHYHPIHRLLPEPEAKTQTDSPPTPLPETPVKAPPASKRRQVITDIFAPGK